MTNTPRADGLKPNVHDMAVFKHPSLEIYFKGKVLSFIVDNSARWKVLVHVTEITGRDASLSTQLVGHDYGYEHYHLVEIM